MVHGLWLPRIVVDFPRWSHLAFAVRDAQPLREDLVRATIDPQRGRIDLATVDRRGSEFPRIDDRRTGRPVLRCPASSGRTPTERMVTPGMQCRQVTARWDENTKPCPPWRSRPSR